MCPEKSELQSVGRAVHTGRRYDDNHNECLARLQNTNVHYLQLSCQEG